MGRTKNTIIYSRKAYKGNSISEKKFAENVENTAKIANNQEEHIKLLQEIYPTYNIMPLYTYEHGFMKIEKSSSCRWDSSADAFAAFKNENVLDKNIKKINAILN